MESKGIVVIGGGGLGQAITAKFTSEGWHTLMVSRTEETLASFADKVAANQGSYNYLAIDASIPAEVEKLEAKAAEVLPAVDMLVTCTGRSFLKPLPEITLEEMQLMVQDNFQTVFLTNRAFIPQMVERGSGCIVNISSKVATTGGGSKPTQTYTAMKSAVVGFSQALSKEYRKSGVSVSVVCPGPIDTPMRRRGFPNIDPARLIQPGDVADLLFYLSQRPAMMMELPVVPLALGY